HDDRDRRGGVERSLPGQRGGRRRLRRWRARARGDGRASVRHTAEERMTTAGGTSAVASRLAGSPAQFRERLERWGPTFIKIGQYLALRPDLVRDEYADELMRL